MGEGGQKLRDGIFGRTPDQCNFLSDNVEDDETEDDAAIGDEDIQDDPENYFDDYDETGNFIDYNYH